MSADQDIDFACFRNSLQDFFDLLRRSETANHFLRSGETARIAAGSFVVLKRALGTVVGARTGHFVCYRFRGP